jgi:uracil-xanthine permease
MDTVPHDAPDRIGPDTTPKKTWGERGRSIVHAFTTREGLIGDYDYAFLFKPNLPFLKKSRRAAPFFGLNDKMPVFLALLLGFQHALSMLAGIITPPIILSGAGGANFPQDVQQYLVSTSLIVCGILSSIQITRFHIYKSPYFIGTGLISVVGTSFATIPVATKGLAQMYATGYCPSDSAGNPLPCPKGYGSLLGTQCVCALIEILMSFTSPKVLKKIFPPLVTGPTVTLIGISLVQSGFQDWAGGSGTCDTRPDSGLFSLCPEVGAPHAMPWGSASFIGLGFLVFLTIILCERFGSPIMKSCAVVIGLLVGCIVAAACGYFDDSGIKSAKAASFIWVHTFPLKVYGPIVLPFLAVYIVLAMEAIGDITATCDVSRLEVSGLLFDSRIQGGVLADGLNGIIAGLCTITPMSTFAQNNGVIALTRCANRKAGYACCFWLLIMGIFAKFAAALVAIPASVLGGMTTFLFSAVAISGIRIISTTPFTRRNRFILTAAMSVGFGATLVPSWFSYVFTYNGDNHALLGFYNAIVLVMETGFAVTAFLAVILNLILPEEIEDEEVPELTADEADEKADEEEWSRIQRNSVAVPRNGSTAKTVSEPGKSEAEKRIVEDVPPTRPVGEQM